MATRYECIYSARVSGHHTSGKGKPTRKRCALCGGTLLVMHGRYGVFKWRGDGRYRADDALHACEREGEADKIAMHLGGDTHCVRWIHETDPHAPHHTPIHQ